MGWAQRYRERRAAMLQGLKVAVDVQHLYRAHKPNDRGSLYTLANGTRTTEASAALIYAASLKRWLMGHGAEVLANDPAKGILIGRYSTRNRMAAAWGAQAYLACHLNAGGGYYALAEHMGATLGKYLATQIAKRLDLSYPAITSGHVRALSSTDRGAVCIQYLPLSVAAVLCEPFFGDNPVHQPLLAAPELDRIGTLIGEAVAAWWQGRRT